MNEKIWIPQKNLEDFCRIYAGLTNAAVEDHPSFTTYQNPGFFYSRNFIKAVPADSVKEIAAQIIENAKKGNPHLTTYTKELLPADADSVFQKMGFQTMLTQYGMTFEKGTPFDTSKDDHVKIIDKDALSAWTDTMIEGFRDEGKEREDVIYENMIQDPGTFFLAYCSDGQIKGTAMLYFTDDYPGVAEVAVPKHFRGNKIATTLLLRILQMVHEYEKPGVTLQASVMGRPVYETLGFKQVSEIRNILLS